MPSLGQISDTNGFIEPRIRGTILLMEKALRSPWLTVVLAITAMTIVYTFYLHQSGGIASAKSYFCPLKEICENGLCGEDGACAKEDCQRCPYCRKGATS